MHLHNFLVDYRNRGVNNEEELALEIFAEERNSFGVIPCVVGNNNSRPSGRPSSDDTNCRINGLILRDSLRDDLSNHNMHRSCKNDE